MPGLFQQVMSELHIEQYKSSAYHPESQSALEKFLQTLKNMIRTYCFQTEKNTGIKESINCSLLLENLCKNLGFSPLSSFLDTQLEVHQTSDKHDPMSSHICI